MTPFQCRNPNCRAVVGHCDHRQFVPIGGGVPYFRTVRSVCAKCGAGFTWHQASREACQVIESLEQKVSIVDLTAIPSST